MPDHHIFIATENKQVLSKIKLQLEGQSYAVDSTDDGIQALSRVREQQPSLVMLGDVLFRLDGFRICRFLKLDERYSKIPIIFLLSQQNRTDKDLSLELGADACFVEPFDLDRLMEQDHPVTQLWDPSDPRSE